MMVRIVIIDSPVPQERPRGFRTEKGVAFVNPRRSKAWRQQVGFKARAAMRRDSDRVGFGPYTGIMVVKMVFVLPRPKRLRWKRQPMVPLLCGKLPDISNLVKAVEDGMQGIVYENDAQIAVELVAKWYAAGEAQYGPTEAGVWIEVSEVGPEVTDYCPALSTVVAGAAKQSAVGCGSA